MKERSAEVSSPWSADIQPPCKLRMSGIAQSDIELKISIYIFLPVEYIPVSKQNNYPWHGKYLVKKSKILYIGNTCITFMTAHSLHGTVSSLLIYGPGCMSK